MRSEKISRVEQETLATFQEEIPSIYFSDKSEAEFRAYSDNAAWMYRNLFKFPPKMFDGANLIDFGAGTGENTISLALWGADCTLVEMNPRALDIAHQVFGRHISFDGIHGKHRFIQSSIFDYESPKKYDIVHCRGVLSHTADKEGAFKKIASFLKRGGFLKSIKNRGPIRQGNPASNSRPAIAKINRHRDASRGSRHSNLARTVFGNHWRGRPQRITDKKNRGENNDLRNNFRNL